jgi:hypothetical protein
VGERPVGGSRAEFRFPPPKRAKGLRPPTPALAGRAAKVRGWRPTSVFRRLTPRGEERVPAHRPADAGVEPRDRRRARRPGRGGAALRTSGVGAFGLVHRGAFAGVRRRGGARGGAAGAAAAGEGARGGVRGAVGGGGGAPVQRRDGAADHGGGALPAGGGGDGLGGADAGHLRAARPRRLSRTRRPRSGQPTPSPDTSRCSSPSRGTRRSGAAGTRAFPRCAPRSSAWSCARGCRRPSAPGRSSNATWTSWCAPAASRTTPGAGGTRDRTRG